MYLVVESAVQLFVVPAVRPTAQHSPIALERMVGSALFEEVHTFTNVSGVCVRLASCACGARLT